MVILPERANETSKEALMNKNSEQHDTYIIPPNFIEGGTLFGGMFKIRNVIEAGILAVSVGVPVFSINISLIALRNGSILP